MLQIVEGIRKTEMFVYKRVEAGLLAVVCFGLRLYTSICSSAPSSTSFDSASNRIHLHVNLKITFAKMQTSHTFKETVPLDTLKNSVFIYAYCLY